MTFVDSDDTLLPTTYEEMLSNDLSYTCDCVCCGAIHLLPQGKIKKCYPSFNKDTLCDRQTLLQQVVKRMLGFSKQEDDYGDEGIWNKIFKTSIIRENNIVFNKDRGHGEDWEFVLDYFARVNNALFLRKALYQYDKTQLNTQISRLRKNYLQITFYDRKKWTALYPQFEWESKEKIQTYLESPFRATKHYKTRLSGKPLKEKLKQDVVICKNDELWRKYALKFGGQWQEYLDSDKKLYSKLKSLAFEKKFTNQCKAFLSKIKRKFK